MTQTSKRPENFDEDTERKELQWWEKYSKIESEICWVQPPIVHRILRRSYVREILEISGKGTRVLELGCGDGWLTLLVAKNGGINVTGIDFSPEQIDLACNKASASGAGKNVKFLCHSATEHINTGEKYNTIIVHGFLHHLSATEIRDTLKEASTLLERGGNLLVFEPTRYDSVLAMMAPINARLSRKLLNVLKTLPSRGKKYYLRRYSAKENRSREIVASRGWGRPPLWPFPKRNPI